jgi:hypothetical protein
LIIAIIVLIGLVAYLSLKKTGEQLPVEKEAEKEDAYSIINEVKAKPKRKKRAKKR